MSGTAVADQIASRMEELSFYVLWPDIEARGLGESTLIEGVRTVDYGGFVDLVVEHDVTQAWL